MVWFQRSTARATAFPIGDAHLLTPIAGAAKEESGGQNWDMECGKYDVERTRTSGCDGENEDRHHVCVCKKPDGNEILLEI